MVKALKQINVFPTCVLLSHRISYSFFTTHFVAISKFLNTICLSCFMFYICVSLVCFPEARQIGNLQGESRAIAAVARYGLSTLLKAAEVNDSVPHCWPHGVRLKLLREAWPEITEDVTTIISSPELCDLVPCATPQSSAQLMVLGPPTGKLQAFIAGIYRFHFYPINMSHSHSRVIPQSCLPPK